MKLFSKHSFLVKAITFILILAFINQNILYAQDYLAHESEAAQLAEKIPHDLRPAYEKFRENKGSPMVMKTDKKVIMPTVKELIAEGRIDFSGVAEVRILNPMKTSYEWVRHRAWRENLGFFLKIGILFSVAGFIFRPFGIVTPILIAIGLPLLLVMYIFEYVRGWIIAYDTQREMLSNICVVGGSKFAEFITKARDLFANALWGSGESAVNEYMSLVDGSNEDTNIPIFIARIKNLPFPARYFIPIEDLPSGVRQELVGRRITPPNGVTIIGLNSEFVDTIMQKADEDNMSGYLWLLAERIFGHELLEKVPHSLNHEVRLVEFNRKMHKVMQKKKWIYDAVQRITHSKIGEEEWQDKFGTRSHFKWLKGWGFVKRYVKRAMEQDKQRFHEIYLRLIEEIKRAYPDWQVISENDLWDIVITNGQNFSWEGLVYALRKDDGKVDEKDFEIILRIGQIVDAAAGSESEYFKKILIAALVKDCMGKRGVSSAIAEKVIEELMQLILLRGKVSRDQLQRYLSMQSIESLHFLKGLLLDGSKSTKSIWINEVNIEAAKSRSLSISKLIKVATKIKKAPLSSCGGADVVETIRLLEGTGIKRGSKIVSVGIGNDSVFGFASAKMGVHYKGYELHPEYINDICRMQLFFNYNWEESGGSVEHVLGEFSCGKNSSSKDIPDNSQDAVFILTGALSDPINESDPKEVFIEALRVIKPGGMIIAGSFSAVWNMDLLHLGSEKEDAERVMKDVLDKPEWAGKVKLEELKDITYRGLMEGTVYRVSKRTGIPSAEDRVHEEARELAEAV